MRSWLALIAVAVAGAVVSSAWAIESTIVRGVGIGKVKVGMTRAQVERILGKDEFFNGRTTVDGTTYIEYGWNFGTWSVGFLGRGDTYRVAQVATDLRAQRTPERIGVGSAFRAVVRAYPQAICRSYYVNMGSTVSHGPPYRTSSSALVVAKNRRQLAFLVHPADKYRYEGLWVVYQVIVRNSIPGAVDFVPKSHCDSDWQQLGRPYKSPFLPPG